MLLSLTLPGSASGQGKEQPEKTIIRLEFRVVDVKPDARPVKSFRYSYEFYTAGEEKSQQKYDVPYRSEDGTLRIPKPFPPFGRVRVWVDADDVEKGYRRGYGSFSYRIDETKPFEPPTIQLEVGTVLTGKVLDAETGKPIVGAEVCADEVGPSLQLGRLGRISEDRPAREVSSHDHEGGGP